ncbi:AAA domain-containing protein [Bacteroides uniformis]|uniref:AAA domain-containing protein n=1 Tax=Bacteroides uniformis TaxID=820 RepID=UPI0011073869|nr:AAA domain-containing protein [Bacteroides uniformis]MDC1839440.1 AAA domain-containing protein [Bacteroides uniformis]MDC1866151.1 AAA domain-containing protein [Bacteroides uniformis]MDC1870360.1 AAA domain-containing protein [Bacteroides uniformis]
MGHFLNVVPGPFSSVSYILAGVFDKNNCVAIQGPPGTGKTYRLAQYAATLLKQGKSVLVTALTNQALMELAKKEDLKDYIFAGKVSKSSMTIDEKRELPCLVPIKENKCDACSGYLSLTSFYVSSTWAATLAEIPFDYVLMDEASQALLPMIAAAFKLGKQVVWIGDQKQLSPIVAINDDIISDKDWSQIINGFDTLCNTQKLDSYLLSDTFRLMPRAADSTGVFYNNNLRSVSKIVDVPIQLPFINPKGGPNFLDLELETGKKAPINAFEQIIDVVKRYMSYHLVVKLLSYQNSKTLLGSYKNTSFLIGKVQVCLTQLR